MLDEPTAGVDVDSQEALAALLDELIATSASRSSTSRTSSARSSAFAERLLLVRGGIVFDGPPAIFPRSGTTLPMSILDPDFMRLAFAAGAVVGVLAPAVGFFLVQRRMSLIGDGIGHVAFAGVAFGYLIGISPVATALVASVVGAIVVEWLRATQDRR